MNTHDRKSLVLALLILAAVVVFFLWALPAKNDPMPSGLAALADRIEADPGQPQWKRDLVPRIRERRIGRFTATVTMYAPNCPADCGECRQCRVDRKGGGPNAAWGGLRLRRGHCAVGIRTQAAPFGSILYCPAVVDHLLVVVDVGPGVEGRERLDICLPSVPEYLAADRHNGQRYPVWRLTRLTLDEVLAMEGAQ